MIPEPALPVRALEPLKSPPIQVGGLASSPETQPPPFPPDPNDPFIASLQVFVAVRTEE